MNNLASYAVDFYYKEALKNAEKAKEAMNKHAIDAIEAVRSAGVYDNEAKWRTVHNYNWHMERHNEASGGYYANKAIAESLKKLIETIERGV